MSKPLIKYEPAERPYMVALSESEVIALMQWHISCARKIPKKVGAAVLGEAYEIPFFSTKKSRALFDTARELLNAHVDRSKNLELIIRRPHSAIRNLK